MFTECMVRIRRNMANAQLDVLVESFRVSLKPLSVPVCPCCCL